MYYGPDGKPISQEEAVKYWADPELRRVAHSTITTENGEIEISTVFLIIDHSFGHGPPVLWETMIFGGPLDEDQGRYTSAEDALVGHHRWVTLILTALDQAGVKVLRKTGREGAGSPNGGLSWAAGVIVSLPKDLEP